MESVLLGICLLLCVSWVQGQCDIATCFPEGTDNLYMSFPSCSEHTKKMDCMKDLYSKCKGQAGLAEIGLSMRAMRAPSKCSFSIDGMAKSMTAQSGMMTSMWPKSPMNPHNLAPKQPGSVTIDIPLKPGTGDKKGGGSGSPPPGMMGMPGMMPMMPMMPPMVSPVGTPAGTPMVPPMMPPMMDFEMEMPEMPEMEGMMGGEGPMEMWEDMMEGEGGMGMGMGMMPPMFMPGMPGMFGPGMAGAAGGEGVAAPGLIGGGEGGGAARFVDYRNAAASTNLVTMEIMGMTLLAILLSLL